MVALLVAVVVPSVLIPGVVVVVAEEVEVEADTDVDAALL
jgi:hypothetical protein